jgi:hypothetical protein
MLALAALIVVVGPVAGVIALDRYLDPFDDQPFDPAAWAATGSQGRGRMARDAICHLPAGLPAARVRALLGEPEPVPGPGGPVDGFGNRLQHSETWSYYLGCWSRLSWYAFDSAFLYVHFGPGGQVAAAEIAGG